MSKRIERANSEIQKVISQIIMEDLNDPRISGLLTVLSVKTSSDFRHAKVRVGIVSGTLEESKQVFENLKKTSGYIQKLLCERVKLPFCPKLDFVLDEGALHSVRIHEILEGLNIPKLEDEQDE